MYWGRMPVEGVEYFGEKEAVYAAVRHTPPQTVKRRRIERERNSRRGSPYGRRP